MSCSYDFRSHRQHSQRWCYFSQTTLLWFEVLPDLSPALPSLSSALPGLSLPLPDGPDVPSCAPRCSQTYHNHSHGTHVPIIRDPRYSEGPPECPPRVWYSPDIDASMFTLHILSDIVGVCQWLKYIVLMGGTSFNNGLLRRNRCFNCMPKGWSNGSNIKEMCFSTTTTAKCGWIAIIW